MNVIEAILFMMYREINRYMKLASYRKKLIPKYQTKAKKKGKKIFFLEIWHIWSIFIQYYIMNLL